LFHLFENYNQGFNNHRVQKSNGICLKQQKGKIVLITDPEE